MDPNRQVLGIAGPMEASSSSRGMGSAPREACPRVLDTAGSGKVSDDGDRNAHDRRRDRIFTMETVIVILSAVVGVVAFAMGVF